LNMMSLIHSSMTSTSTLTLPSKAPLVQFITTFSRMRPRFRSMSFTR
jgi:hypothetical protein